MVRTVMALWCVAGAVAGCCSPAAPPVRLGPAPAQLPITGRTPVEPDVSAVPTDAPSAPARRPTEYRRLTAAECRSLAVANAPMADDLDHHPESAPSVHPKSHQDAARNAETSRLVRGHAADELRNRAAGEALDEFFKLAHAEGQFDLLAAAGAELRAQLSVALKAEQGGLKDRADIPGLRRKLLDLETQRAKLEASAGALNASLRARLNLAANDPLPLWPADPLKVSAGDPDVEQAVATGLRYRPDLNLLRILADGSGGEMANAVLTNLSPLLGKLNSNNPLAALLAPILGPLAREPKRQKAAATARIAGILHSRERQAEAEIRAAAAMVRGDRAAVAARVLDVKQVESRIEELQTRQKAGMNVTADLVSAKIDLLKAKGDLLTAVTDWHSAEVKLHQAMGLLVRE